jgi:succinate dehydrogenase / fumarate reductase cytochrome b subunit
MKFALFPGCVLEAAAKEAHTAALGVARALGLELVEIPGWTCCGASHAQDVDEDQTLALNARNIALAEAMGLPILTLCNTCTLMLRKTKHALDNGRKEWVNRILAGTGLEYRGVSDVTHLLWVLVDHFGLDRLRQAVSRPLKGLKVAPFYGCHLLRPPRVMTFEDHAAPSSLEAVIQALGAEPVEYGARLKCCGFHAQFPAEASVSRMTGESLLEAERAGADLIATPCPLCQMQLDMHQPEGHAAAGPGKDIPVLHLPQLIGLALGLEPKELGLGRHLTSACAVAARLSG